MLDQIRPYLLWVEKPLEPSPALAAGRRLRLFHIWHEPWCQSPVDTIIDDDVALAATGPWHAAATLEASCYAPGVKGVLIGPPRRVTRVR